MSTTISLVFPHQLFEQSPLLELNHPIYLIEEYLFFKQYKFHKTKLAFHRASMKFYASYLKEKGKEVNYIDCDKKEADIREFIKSVKGKVDCIHYLNPTDNWLEKRIEKTAKTCGIKLKEYENQLFLNTREDNQHFFKASKKKFFQATFYKQERKKRNILIEKDGEPVGEKWSFDAENRKKFPTKKEAPKISYPYTKNTYKEAVKYVEKHFSKNPGKLSEKQLYPYDFDDAKKWLDEFLEERFKEFGDYEDAIVAKESILNHSVLTPMLNTGLLTPQLVLESALEFAKKKDIPINSLEGFVRQIIGWREFIRGVYECKGSEERTRNYWGFSRKIPTSFYDGSTGIEPVDNTIKKVLETGYCHHIERLMVLGNFMLLCEFDPDEVYRWFMELFIDAYDWVMVTNVYGMSQFADGGLMATKPYISSSNYLMKMSDYKKGDWQKIWDALFWRFMHIQRDFFEKNPRLNMLINTYDKMSAEKRNNYLETADKFLEKLEE